MSVEKENIVPPPLQSPTKTELDAFQTVLINFMAFGTKNQKPLYSQMFCYFNCSKHWKNIAVIYYTALHYFSLCVCVCVCVCLFNIA